MKTKCKNGNTVETWYDRKARCYVTQTIDAAGLHVGDGEGAGTKAWSLLNHADAVKNNGGERRVLNLSGRMVTIQIDRDEDENPEPLNV